MLPNNFAASSHSRLASASVGASAMTRTIGSVLLARIKSQLPLPID